jgi:hypothetical protein
MGARRSRESKAEKKPRNLFLIAHSKHPYMAVPATTTISMIPMMSDAINIVIHAMVSKCARLCCEISGDLI